MMAHTTTLPRRRPADDLVLASKLAAPRLPGWMVARPRLDTRIAVGAAGPLTVVTGPPGAGKTTALASWAAGMLPRRANKTPVAITGGTGAYNGARGTALVTDSSPTQTDVEITLLP